MLTGAEDAQSDPCTSPSNSTPDEQLDIQKALQIVSEHYGKRNATFLSYCLIVATLYESSLWQGPELALTVEQKVLREQLPDSCILYPTAHGRSGMKGPEGAHVSQKGAAPAHLHSCPFPEQSTLRHDTS